MIATVSPAIGRESLGGVAPAPGNDVKEDSAQVGQKLEHLLWTEMLKHAGLESAITQGTGESAAAFSRYVVEAIAADLAENHPLGLREDISPAAVISPVATGASGS